MILLRLPKLVWMGKVESYQVTLEKQLSISRSNSLLFRLAEDGIYALGKPHMRSVPSLRFFFPVSFETVPMFVWLTMALSRRFKEVCRALSLSTLVYSRRSMVQCPWLCARRWWLKLLNFPDLPRSRPLVSVAMAANLSTRSFPFTPVCPGQCTHRNFRKVGVDHCHNPVWASHSTFGSKLIESVRTIARVVRLSPLQAIQRRARVTASTSIVKMELETV